MRFVATLFLLLPVGVAAQDRIEGLVEIPALHNRVNAGVRDSATGPVALFDAPNDESQVSIIIRDRRDLESREHDYEQVSAVVYSREANSGGGFWYRLRYIDEGGPAFGWLNQTNAGAFRSVEMLIRSHLAYLTQAWDGQLYEAPNFDSQAQVILNREESQSVRVVDGFRRGGQEGWYLLALIRGTCSGEPVEVIATGWVPEYSNSGDTNVWYFSRGC